MLAALLLVALHTVAALGGPATTRSSGALGMPVLHLPEGHDQETIPLARAGGWLLARVSINDKDAGYFMVDTGATMTVIDQDAAAKLGLTAIRPSRRERIRLNRCRSAVRR
jgi:predicted aspartyl protease